MLRDLRLSMITRDSLDNTLRPSLKRKKNSLLGLRMEFNGGPLAQDATSLWVKPDFGNN
jgi:hypothetical protein